MPTTMPENPCRSLSAAFLALLLGACAAGPDPQPPQPERAAQTPQEPVELTLNLPEQGGNCSCEQAPGSDRTFLERGVAMLAEGEYIEAVQHFQRYRRLEKQPLAQWEAQLAIAYVSMLPNSPFYDVAAARDSYIALHNAIPEGQQHDSIVLMRQALETFVLMERHIADLEMRTEMLGDDLEKREQALRRLRELTLGQPEGAR